MRARLKRARLAVQRQLVGGLVATMVLNLLQVISQLALVTYMAWAGDTYCLLGSLLWAWLWWREIRA